MENKEKKNNNFVLDGNERQIEITKDDFKLVQHDSKIYDTKFKSKPTTFFKDSLKRFAKSKPAIVGGVIVGILFLMSLIIPISSENVGVYDVSRDGGGQTYERELVPKLFEFGTGFWDGGISRNHIVYDAQNERPAGYKDNTYSNLKTYEEITYGVNSNYGKGGSVHIGSTKKGSDSNFNSPVLSFNSNNDYNISYNLEGELNKGLSFDGYKLVLHYDDTFNLEHNFKLNEFIDENPELPNKYFGTWKGIDDKNNQVEIVLSSEGIDEYYKGTFTFIRNEEEPLIYEFDFKEEENSLVCVTNDFESLSFSYLEDEEGNKTLAVNYKEFSTGETNGKDYYLVGDENTYSKELTNSFEIFDKLEENNEEFPLNQSFNAQIRFIGKTENHENLDSSALVIKNFDITTNDETNKEFIESISFKDGNTVLNRSKTDPNKWSTSVTSNALGYGVIITYCDFRFNQYEDIYGARDRVYGVRELNVFANKGWIELNITEGDNATTDKDILNARIKVISDECPIIEVTEQVGDATYDEVTGDVGGFSIKAKISYYKELGYKEMPKFILGTNASSKDFFKLIFTGLRFSLLFAIGVSLVNIIIGLIWGSVSGYYGGWTDIAMERICDILSGLPSMVIITLVIMYGNQFNWGSSSDVIALMISIFLTGWMGVAHRTRTQFYRFKGREYVLASRTLGAKDARLIFRHILPNSAGTIITGSILMIPSVIFTEASIAYLGLGLKNQVMFGVILSEGNQYYSGEKTFLLIIPTIIMVLLLVSFNLFGNGLRDAFNPSLKGGDK